MKRILFFIIITINILTLTSCSGGLGQAITEHIPSVLRELPEESEPENTKSPTVPISPAENIKPMEVK